MEAAADGDVDVDVDVDVELEVGMDVELQVDVAAEVGVDVEPDVVAMSSLELEASLPAASRCTGGEFNACSRICTLSILPSNRLALPPG